MTQAQQQAEPNFQRVAVNLQQRFAEKVANYEGEIAVMADNHQTTVEALQAEIESLRAANETVPAPKK